MSKIVLTLKSDLLGSQTVTSVLNGTRFGRGSGNKVDVDTGMIIPEPSFFKAGTEVCFYDLCGVREPTLRDLKDAYGEFPEHIPCPPALLAALNAQDTGFSLKHPNATHWVGEDKIFCGIKFYHARDFVMGVVADQLRQDTGAPLLPSFLSKRFLVPSDRWHGQTYLAFMKPGM